MTQSLNAGFELEDEPGIQDLGEEVKPKEVELDPVEPDVSLAAVPDFTHDVETIAALEARIDDLLFLMADVKRVHGMSQQFALEAERLLPGFGKVPLAYYSKDISATRYKVSLEELSKGMWAMIAAAAAAVIAIIVKFISWLGGKKGENGGDAGVSSAVEAVSAQKEELKENAKHIDEVASAASHVSNIEMTDEKGHTEEAHNLTDFILGIFKDQGAKYDHSLAFLTSTNPFYHDIINHGEYTQAVFKAIGYVEQINDILQQKLHLLADIVRHDLRDSGSVQQKLQNDAGLNLLMKPIEIRLASGQGPIRAAADGLAAVRQETEKKKTHQTVRFEQMLSKLAKAHQDRHFELFLDRLEDSVKMFDDSQDVLKAIEKMSGDVSDDGQKDHNSEGIGGKIRQVISALGQDISATARLEAEIKHYLRYMKDMEREATGLSIETAREIEALYKRSKEPVPRNIQGFLDAVHAAQEAKKQQRKKGIIRGVKGIFSKR